MYKLRIILDQVLLGFYIAFGMTLFDLVYTNSLKIIKKVLAVIVTV